MAIELPRRNRAGVARTRIERPPTAADVPRVQGSRDPGLGVPAPVPSGLEDVARAVGDIGDRIQRADDRMELARNANKSAQAVARAAKRFGEERDNIARDAQLTLDLDEMDIDQGGPGRADEFGRRADRIESEVVASSGLDERNRELLEARLAGLRAPFSNAVAKQAQADAVAQTKATVDQAINEILNQIGREPGELTDLMDAGLDIIIDPDNGLSAAERQVRVAELRRAAMIGALRGMATTDPAKAREILRRGHFRDNGALELSKFLEPGDAEKLKTAVDKRFVADTRLRVRSATAAMMDASPSFVSAARRIADGDLAGTELGVVLSGLEPRLKAAMTEDAMAVAREHFALDKDIRDEEERRAAEASDLLLGQFLSESDYDKRETLLNAIKLLGDQTPREVFKLTEMHNSRAAFGVTANPGLFTQLDQDILAGAAGLKEIQAQSEFLTQDEYNRLVTRRLAASSKAMANAMRLIDREMGLPPNLTTYPSGELLRLAQKSEAVKARLQRWFEDNDGASRSEIQEQRDIFLGEAKKTVNTELGADAVVRLNRRGATLIPGFDPKDPQGSLNKAIQDKKVKIGDPNIVNLQRDINEAKRRGALK